MEYEKLKKQSAKIALWKSIKGKRIKPQEMTKDSEATGNAFTDGNHGLVRVFAAATNPKTYLRKAIAGMGAVLGPPIMIFMTISMICIVLVAFIFDFLKPAVAIKGFIDGVVKSFAGDRVFVNEYMTEDEIEKIISESGCAKEKEAVIRFALSKVGYPYSQPQRTSGRAYDCSSLVYYCWKQAGIDTSDGSGYPPTAAYSAWLLEKQGRTYSDDNMEGFSLEPGDLIYYGGKGEEYLGIYHVAIYIGRGYVVEAMSEEYGVVYKNIGLEDLILIGRPGIDKEEKNERS